MAALKLGIVPFRTKMASINAVRTKLAEAMLSAASESATDIVTLENRAIEAMARHYSSRILWGIVVAPIRS